MFPNCQNSGGRLFVPAFRKSCEGNYLRYHFHLI